MTLTARLTAALTPQVLNAADRAYEEMWWNDRDGAYAAARAVLIAALLPVVEEPKKSVDYSTLRCICGHTIDEHERLMNGGRAQCEVYGCSCRRVETRPAEGPTPAPGDFGTRTAIGNSLTLASGRIAPPDDTLARVAPTCATCKHLHENEHVSLSLGARHLCVHPSYIDVNHGSLQMVPDINPDGTPFGCTLHEAVRPDAPRAETVDSPKET